MKSTQTRSAYATLVFRTQQFGVLMGDTFETFDCNIAAVLEAYRWDHDPLKAYDAYQRICRYSINVSVPPWAASLTHEAGLSISGSHMFVGPLTNVSEIRRYSNLAAKATYNNRSALDSPSFASHIVDVSEVSGITLYLLRQYQLFPDVIPKSREEFIAISEHLFERGLLTTPFGQVDRSLINHLQPLCPDYGFSRGTPIDRFYLRKFINFVRPTIIGPVLEIGASLASTLRHGLPSSLVYKCMDIETNIGADIVGNIHDPDACLPSAWGSILAFNILEHCHAPQIAIDNMYKWLLQGGKVYVMTPNIQRVHYGPQDYWRIMPDAYRHMFKQYSSSEVVTYGNLATNVAALLGCAAEEVGDYYLGVDDPLYPTVTCVIASK